MKKLIITLVLGVVVVGATYFGYRSCSDAPVATKGKHSVDIPIDKALQARIDSFVGNVPFVGTLGMMVYDATAQKTLYAFHEDSLMRPASCMKMLTCITALKTYGKSMVHHNRLYCSGKMNGDTLVGDITIKLKFDPFFNRDSLLKLTSVLKEKNIKNIKGRVVLDMAEYYPMQHEIHWTMGDLKTRMLSLCFLGGKRLTKESMYALAHHGVAVKRDSIVYGRVDGRKKPQLIADITTPMHYSLLRAMKNSSNINAECLLYPLGYKVSKKGNFRHNGTLELRWFVNNQLHMDPDKVCSIHDGCGLCPDDRLSPRVLVRLLDYARQHQYIYNEVMEDLPLSGIDGTLHNRLYKPNVKGVIKAKTGTLTREAGISTLAGYYTTKNNHLIIFAIMNNECPVADGRWWQDKFLTKIVDGLEFEGL